MEISSLYDRMVETGNWNKFSGLGLTEEDLKGYSISRVEGDIILGKQGYDVYDSDNKILNLKSPIFPTGLAVYFYNLKNL